MNKTQTKMAAIFNEWARRYAENPDEFGSVLDENGYVAKNYGQACALYYMQIARDLKTANVES